MEDPKIVFEKLTPFTESDIQILEATNEVRKLTLDL